MCASSRSAGVGLFGILRRPDRERRGWAMYGRSDEAWDQLASAGLKFLVERAQLRKVTTYQGSSGASTMATWS